MLDLIQMRLSQGISGVSEGEEDPDSANKKDGKGGVSAATGDKLKASNFPASLLRIGSWEVGFVSFFDAWLVLAKLLVLHFLVI